MISSRSWAFVYEMLNAKQLNTKSSNRQMTYSLKEVGPRSIKFEY